MDAHIDWLETRAPAGAPSLDGAAPALADSVRAALRAAWLSAPTLDPAVLALPGMSGRRYRQFINTLVGAVALPRYLEVGVWAGSTLCAALAGNRVSALAIDNWSEFGGPKAAFFHNVAQYRGAGADVHFIEGDFRAVAYDRIGRYNIYLFDGPHLEQDQYDGVALAQPALDNEFVLIVDDWNYEAVRAGTRRAVTALGLTLDFAAEIRTTLDGSHPAVAFQNSDWHNGYLIAVARKPAAQ
jgi:hypothetical protein